MFLTYRATQTSFRTSCMHLDSGLGSISASCYTRFAVEYDIRQSNRRQPIRTLRTQSESNDPNKDLYGRNDLCRLLRLAHVASRGCVMRLSRALRSYFGAPWDDGLGSPMDNEDTSQADASLAGFDTGRTRIDTQSSIAVLASFLGCSKR